MAIVRHLTLGPPTSRVHPSVTDAVVQVVSPVDGAKLIQISTFGSDDRQSEPKVSQTIQLDAESAIVLRDFIEATFSIEEASK